MTMNFGALWQNANPDAVGENNEPPEPGRYDVALAGAGAWIAKSSGNPTMKLTWRRVEDGYEWDDIYGFKTEGAANYSKKVAREVGVDVDAVADLDQLDSALKAVVGGFFIVDVQQNGDRRNTYVAGTLTGDVPIDTSDMQPTPIPAAVGDNSIPF